MRRWRRLGTRPLELPAPEPSLRAVQQATARPEENFPYRGLVLPSDVWGTQVMPADALQGQFRDLGADTVTTLPRSHSE